MRDFASCFGESGVQIADSSSKLGANENGNAVTCVYQTQLRLGNADCRITVVWSKSALGQPGLTILIADDISLLDIKVGPPTWQWKRKGSKTLSFSSAQQLHVFWDLSAAKFAPASGPEPSEGFYVAVVSGLRMVLLLGDLPDEAYRITGASDPGPGAVCVAKKQHIYGSKIYTARARFCDSGRCHDIAIECSASSSVSKEPCLEIRVDRRRVMQVKRLPWKFRGNQTIVVDGAPIQVLWDVHSWLFASSAPSNAVFMFHTAPDNADMPQTRLGFSLLLYAWKVQ